METTIQGLYKRYLGIMGKSENYCIGASGEVEKDMETATGVEFRYCSRVQASGV